MAGRSEEAFDFTKKAMRLDPHNQANPLYYIWLAHFCLKQFEEAVNSLVRALRYSPRHVDYLLCLASAYGHLGREKEAKAAVDLYLKILSLDHYLSWWKGGVQKGATIRNIILMEYYPYPPFKDAEMKDFFENGLVLAGIEEPIQPIKQ